MHHNNQTSLYGINESFAVKGWARFKTRTSARVPLGLALYFILRSFLTIKT